MKSALIGSTGFVGSNLAAEHDFTDTFNSASIGQIEGRKYDLVVSAANRADSFRINSDPEGDRREVLSLVKRLQKVTIGRLVLISTVCVYPGVERPDEESEIDPARLTPYGRNRLELEHILRDHFELTVVRLPQLYGRHMRKGVVYDLLNDYRVEFLRPGDRYQFYDLARLWSDIQLSLKYELPALNLAPPPVTVFTVAADCFGVTVRSGSRSETPLDYTRSMTTKHSALFDRSDGYIESVDESLESIRRFVARERTAQEAVPYAE